MAIHFWYNKRSDIGGLGGLPNLLPGSVDINGSTVCSGERKTAGALFSSSAAIL
jgi:hypothetical protein